MSKIPNARKFLEMSAEMFRKMKIDSFPYDPMKARFRPEEHYTSGHCAEFAYVFAKFAKENGIDASINVIFSNQYDSETEEHLGKVLSHCVVEIEHEGETVSFDINGDEAKETWFIRVDYIYYRSAMNYKLEFENIPFSDDAKKRMADICKEQTVPFNVDDMEIDSGILKSITDKRSHPQLKNEMSA